MKTGRYSLKQLLMHNEIEQIIIPEIQRDYVWEISNVQKLIDDILAGFNKKESLQLEIKVNGKLESRESVNQFLSQEYERLIYQQKLGFIYAYHDRDYVGKFFLIDGQQRITTLFLMLLSIYKSTQKVSEFKEFYFSNSQPKVDYKVREQSHDFILLLISNVLAGKNFKNDERFYSTEYLKDTTIRHLIQNFEFIESEITKIGDKEGFLNYLEDFVEVNYFDTHLSEQGEQLYIYMNSRGEQLSHQEIIRAELMQKMEDPNLKIEFGNEWEKWQNFFWKHRSNNENADKGFEEFLKWATIIHLAIDENALVENFVDSNKTFTKKQLKENYIKDSFRDELQRKQKDELYSYQVKYLDYEFLRKLFDALEWSYENKTGFIPIHNKWLANQISVLDYVILLPILHFQSINKWESNEERTKAAERLAMFLKNITYFEAVSKNPDSAVLDTLEIVNKLTINQNDVTQILSLQNVTKTILTDAEKYKLELFENETKDRVDWEKLIWAITLDEEFSKFLMGDITVIWRCLEIERLIKADFALKATYSEYVTLIKDVIYKQRSSDKLRRLILCKFDYLIESGTGGGGLEKYSFIGNGSNWEVLREWKETLVKDNFIDLMVWIKNKGNLDLNTLLSDAKKDFLPTGWREAFAETPALLKYCTNKKILWQNENRIQLLEKTNYSPTLSKEIQCALLQNSFEHIGMWIYENDYCVLEFDWDAFAEEMDFKNTGSKGFALNVRYLAGNQQWKFTLLNRTFKIIDLIDFSDKPEWNLTEDQLTIEDGILYQFDTNKTLLQNNVETVEKLNDLFVKVKTLLVTNKL